MLESKSSRWRKENPAKWKNQKDLYRDRRNQKRRDKYNSMSIEARKIVNATRRERWKMDPDAKSKTIEYSRLCVLRLCGMTLKEARDWYSAKEKVCSICGSRKKLGIDHDHKNGVVRGILCLRCNLGLGYFKDDVVLVANALDYLKGLC